MAECRLVTNDLSGNDQWIVQVYEFNDKHLEQLIQEDTANGDPDHEDAKCRLAVRSHMEAFSYLCRDIADHSTAHDIKYVRSKFLNLRIDPDRDTHTKEYIRRQENV